MHARRRRKHQHVELREAFVHGRDEFFALEADVFVPAALELELGLAEAKNLKAKVVVDGQVIATYDLYPTADVPAAGFFGRAWDSLRLIFH